jgi:pimeloyl-ACP methyl ester carboxylesterase
MSLVHHWPAWEAVRERYGDIGCPVLLLYGDHDRSAPQDMIEQVVEFVERRSHS